MQNFYVPPRHFAFAYKTVAFSWENMQNFCILSQNCSVLLLNICILLRNICTPLRNLPFVRDIFAFSLEVFTLENLRSLAKHLHFLAKLLCSPKNLHLLAKALNYSASSQLIFFLITKVLWENAKALTCNPIPSHPIFFFFFFTITMSLKGLHNIQYHEIMTKIESG